MTSEQDKANTPPVGEGFNTRRTEETTNTWLTPLSLIQSLGEFDLDPCCPPVMPWRTATLMHHYPDMGCGLSSSWSGIWCNKCGWEDRENVYQMRLNRAILEKQPSQKWREQYLQSLSQQDGKGCSRQGTLSSSENLSEQDQMHQMRKAEAGGPAVFPAKETEEKRPQLVVQGLLPDHIQRNDAVEKNGPQRSTESAYRKKEARQEREGQADEANQLPHAQPSSPTSHAEKTLDVDTCVVGAMQGALGKSLRILRQGNCSVNSGSLHSANSPGLPRHRPLEYASRLHDMQHVEATPSSRGVEGLQADLCPTCCSPLSRRPARCWINPPYGEHTFKWMRKFAEHKRGVALIFARTDTKGFHEHVFARAKAIYFLKGRVKFHREDGSCPKNGPAAPSCLVTHTEEDTAAVLNSGLQGFLMRAA